MVQTVLCPGSTFVDVGANWGYFTLLAAARAGPGGTVIAVEPEPRMCDALRANVALNAFSNVTVCQCAATEHVGGVHFLPYDEATGNYGISRVAPATAQGSTILTVAGRPLDDVFAEHGISRVSLLKMDIEGAEALALAGLQRSLATGIVDRLLLEVHPEQLRQLGSSPAEVFGLLQRAEYQGWTLDHSAATSRRAAYSRHLDPRTYLRPFDPSEPLDTWPHFLWARRGQSPL